MKSLNVISTLFIAAVLAAPLQLYAQMEEAPIIELLNSMADKPQEHQAIADYYRKMAGEAKDQALLHENMKGSYRHSHAKYKNLPIGRATGKHCSRIVELQRSMAAEYEALAEVHENAAKQ